MRVARKGQREGEVCTCSIGSSETVGNPEFPSRDTIVHKGSVSYGVSRTEFSYEVVHSSVLVSYYQS